MERFAEFGENLNRMAGALHHLENNMQHLLGVTSRVTAAMLLLHGSLSHVSPPSGRRGESGGEEKEKSKFSEKEWAEKSKLRHELKTTRSELDNARYAKSQIESALSQRARFNSNLVFKDMQYQRRRANREIQENALEPENILAQKESFHNMTAAADSAKPIDLTPSKLVIDTEYGFAHDKDTPHDVAKGAYDQLSDKEKDQRKVLTEFSVRVVNSLGQTLDKFTKNIHHDLPGQEVYSLTAKTQAEQDAFAKALSQLKDKNKTVDVSTASQELAAFAQKNNLNLASLAASDKPTDPKMVGRNLVNADFAVLGNSLNKQLGDTLGLNAIHPNNLKEQISDPLVVQFRSITAMLGSIKNSDAVAQIATSYGLDATELQALIKSGKTSAKQEEIAKVFKVDYKGGGAHTAESDTDVYARLLPRVESMFRILNTSLMREQILSKYGVTDAQLLEANKRAEEDHLLNPENIKLTQALEEESKRIEDLIKKLEELEKGINPGSSSTTPTPTTSSSSSSSASVPPPSTPTPTPTPSASSSPPPPPSSFFKRFLDKLTKLFEGVDYSRLLTKGFSEVVSEIKGSLKQVLAASTAIAGASMGLSQMASPDTFSTFQGSLQMVGMQLGRYLIRPMLDFSYYLQLLAHNLSNLSPETQKLLESIGTWSIAIAAVGIALKGIWVLISPIFAVGKALWFLAAAAYKAAIRLATGPVGSAVGSAISGIASSGLNLLGLSGGLLKFAGVTGIAYEALALLSDQLLGTRLSLIRWAAGLNEATDKKAEAINKKHTEGIVAGTDEELKDSLKNYEVNRAKVITTTETTEEERKKFSKAVSSNNPSDWQFLDSEHPMVKARNKMPGALSPAVNSHIDGTAKAYAQAEANYQKAKSTGDQTTADKNLAAMARYLSEMEEARVQSTWFSRKNPDKEFLKEFSQAAEAQKLPGRVNPNGVTKEQLDKSKREKAKEAFEKGGGFQGLAAAFQSFRSQPQYMGVEEAHRRVQIQALGMDPIEQKINEIRQNELKDMLRHLAVIAGEGPRDNTVNNILAYGATLLQGR